MIWPGLERPGYSKHKAPPGLRKMLGIADTYQAKSSFLKIQFMFGALVVGAICPVSRQANPAQ
jgi:hypothetical protein